MKVFGAFERNFKTNGLGRIQPLKCQETKKKSLDGWYVEVEAPIRYKDILIADNLLFVETKEKRGQPFRIANPTYSDRRISFTAKHITFDTEKYLLVDVRPTNLNGNDFLNWINDRTDSESPFFVSSNIATKATEYFIRKSYFEALETAGETFNGVYDLDGFHISLKDKVGTNNGNTVIYGKNSQAMKIYEEWDEVCTKLLPVGPDGLLLPELYIKADINYPTPYTHTESFSIDKEDENGNEKTESQILQELRTQAIEYVNTHKYPKINYEVQSDIHQELGIGDTVYIKHPLVMLKAEVLAYTYDTLTKKIRNLVFGNYVRDVQKAFRNAVQLNIQKTHIDFTEDLIRTRAEITSALNQTRTEVNDALNNTKTEVSSDVNQAITDLMQNVQISIRDLETNIDSSLLSLGNSVLTISTNVDLNTEEIRILNVKLEKLTKEVESLKPKEEESGK